VDQVAVTVSGRQILVNGEPIHLRGVCWNPVGKGGEHPGDLDFSGFAEIDIPLMQAIGINAVRTYETLTDRAVLDRFQAAGIFVLNSVYAWGGAAADSVVAPIEAVKDHPAVLLWVLGNEWNYNGLYTGMSHEDSLARLNEVAGHVRSTDPTRPIVSVYGELPSAATLAAMPDIDVWGVNVYRNLGFGTLFDDWAARSGKPLFLAEYGADAWNGIAGAYDPEAQAYATRLLTELLVDNSVVHGDGVVSGGTLFEWADEWWKAGEPNTQETGGAAPGGGPYPDNIFNEEWWGIVDIDRSPRPAYSALGAVFEDLGPTPGTARD
jgi:beta-galactosidase/beta-glucuronidase